MDEKRSLRRFGVHFGIIPEMEPSSADHGDKVKWESRSKRHRDKFEKLVKIPPDKIKMIGSTRVCFDNQFMIGNGCRGTSVYVGLLEDGTEVAVKRMLSHLCSPMAEKEKRLLTLPDLRLSEHIVNYRHYEYEDPFCYLVVDLCEMTLEEYVGSRSMAELRADGPKIIKELLTGLAALHNGKVKVLHMDLKPQNILVDADGRMKLTDFGISRELDEGQTTLLTGEQGTAGWGAKESIGQADRKNGKVKFKRKSDVQAMGMICFFVLTKGEHPFGDRFDRMLNIKNGKPVNLSKLNHPRLVGARNLISWMLSSDIEERPYVEQALHHPYLNLSDDVDQQLLPVPFERRMTFPLSLVFLDTHVCSHVFHLSESVYNELLLRSELEIQFTCHHRQEDEQHMMCPASISVSVNGTPLTIQQDVTKTSYKPLYLKQVCQPGENTIETVCPHSHLFRLRLVRRRPLVKVIYNLLRKRLLLARNNATKITASFGQTRLYSIKVSLKCPMTQHRITIPARGEDCKHIQCFDLKSYLRRNAVEESWRCPVCEERVSCGMLVVDQYMWRILLSLASTETEKIIINSENYWTPVPVALERKEEGKPPKRRKIDENNLGSMSSPAVSRSSRELATMSLSIGKKANTVGRNAKPNSLAARLRHLHNHPIRNLNVASPSPGTSTASNQSSSQTYPSLPFSSSPYFSSG